MSSKTYTFKNIDQQQEEINPIVVSILDGSIVDLDLSGVDIKTISDYRLSDCQKLVTVKLSESMNSIGNNVFVECSSLKTIYIPKSIRTFGYANFRWCDSLENVYYSGTIEDWCNITFLGNPSFSDVDTPMTYASKFYILNENNEWYLPTDIIVPESIKEIKCPMFYKFNQIKNVAILGNTTSISGSSFIDCTSLENLTMSNKIKNIGYRAFYNCSSLATINFLGTTTEWNSITFGNEWNTNTSLSVVVCSDGEVRYD